jgi:hypothetical protein
VVSGWVFEEEIPIGAREQMHDYPTECATRHALG